MAVKDDLGRRGEQLATSYLEGKRYVIVERNWRCPLGEIDIVASIGDTIAFVEVKTRSGVDFGHPFEAITVQKLARLRRLAGAWCETHPGRYGGIRIDAIGIVGDDPVTGTLEHLEALR